MARILFLVPHSIEDGSSRYRVFQYLPYLAARGHECAVRSFSTAKLLAAFRNGGRLGTKLAHAAFCSFRRLLDLTGLQRYDLVVVHREAFPFFTPLFEKLILRRHPRVVFSFDDAVYAGHQNTATFRYSWLYRFKYGSGINSILGTAQHVIAGSEVLAQHARQFTSAVTLIPTVVDLTRYHPRTRATHPEPVTIGWYGSDSTSPYLHAVVPALRRLVDRHGEAVQFRFFGDPKLRLAIPNSEVHPFRLATEIEDLEGLDIGIMPMPDNVWTRGKCAFKAIQYMALGIPTVASPVGMVSDLIQHDANGLCASSEEEWFQALHRLVTNVSLRQRFGEAGRQTIAAKYSLQSWAPRFAAVLESALRVDAKAAPSKDEPSRGRPGTRKEANA